MTLKQFEQRLTTIEQRNRRVEADKAWETCWTRRLVIAVATYLIAGMWLVIIHDTLPWLKAFVPAGGFILSTLTLILFKKLWVEHVYRK